MMERARPLLPDRVPAPPPLAPAPKPPEPKPAPPSPVVELHAAVGNAAVAHGAVAGAAPPHADVHMLHAAVGNAAVARAHEPSSPDAKPKQAAPLKAEAAPRPEGAKGAPAAPSRAPAAKPEGAAPEAAAFQSAKSGDDVVAGLESTPPSRAIEGLREARSATVRVISGEHRELASHPPSLDRPSGLPRKGEPRLAEKDEGKTAEKTKKAQSPTSNAPPPTVTPHVVSTAPLPAPAPKFWQRFEGTAEDSEALRTRGAEALESVPTSDETVDTDPGAPPPLDLSGDADPKQIDAQMNEQQGKLDLQWNQARAGMAEDEGENDIFPTVPHEKLRAHFRPRGAAAAHKAPRKFAEFPPEALEAFDHGAAGKWGDALGEAHSQHESGKQQRLADEDGARGHAAAEIKQLEAQAAKDQTTAQNQGNAEVAGARGEWQKQLEAGQKTYDAKTSSAINEAHGKIGRKQQEAQADVDKEYKKARADADQKKREAEQDAADRKREAEEDSGGFWGWVKSGIKAAISALKDAIGAIFDALRAAVRFIIDQVKKLALWIIEQARKAICEFIELCGDALCLAADVFLAAFPGVRDRAKRAIRKGVAVAQDTVNRAADWLKGAVSKVLDALGDALDFILSVYQKVINKVLDFIEFIAVGLIEILEGLVRLGKSAGQVGDHFWGQLSEEGLGVDLTAPLPIEVPAEKAAATAHAAPAVNEPAAEPPTGAELAIANKTKLDDGDVAVDQVAEPEFDAEFFRQLDLKEGEEREFGENEDPANSVATLMNEATGRSPAGVPAAAEGPVASPGAGENKEDKSEQQLQYLLSQPTPHTCDMPKTGEPAKAGDVPAEMRMYGPFSVGQRLRYYWDQIKRGIAQWWTCNKTKIIVYLALGVLAFVALLIASGGAILALIPPALELLGAYFIGAAIARATEYVGGYIKSAWGGDLAGGAKQLARAFAIILIELVSALIFNIGDVIKSAKGGLKAVTKDVAALAKKTVVRTVKAVGEGVEALAKSGRAILRNGKLLLKGLGKGFGRGVKSLRELASKLWKVVRFRKFKIVFRNQWFQLLGYVNPWVVLLEGPAKLEWVDDKWVKGATKPPGGGVLGAVGTVVKEGVEYKAVLVSMAKSAPKDYRAIFDAFKGSTHASDVIHHLIERQMGRKLGIIAEIINHPKNLIAIPKDLINSVVHLSKIRVMWDQLYKVMRGLSREQAMLLLAHFAAHTEKFLNEILAHAKLLAGQGKLTREALEAAILAWEKDHPTGDAIKAALQAAQDLE